MGGAAGAEGRGGGVDLTHPTHPRVGGWGGGGVIFFLVFFGGVQGRGGGVHGVAKRA